MAKSRGQRCGNIELAAYLSNAAGPVPLVLDLRIAHERWRSSSNPSFNGYLHYPNDMDRTLNETDPDKILQYRTDNKNRPPHAISFMTTIPSTSGCLQGELVRPSTSVAWCSPHNSCLKSATSYHPRKDCNTTD